MNKKLLLILSAFLFITLLPLSVIADEEVTSTEPIPAPPVVETPANEPPAPEAQVPETLNVNLNIRHKDALVWTGSVNLTKGLTVDVSDSSGTARQVPSDSALRALTVADAMSADFNVSDLDYYSDYGAFFINCIDIVAISKNACGSWQYVVNSSYPLVGSEKQVLSSGDTVYFYFGNARRVSLPIATTDTATAFSVVTETYDYTNDTWRPLSGAEVGATQPNPNDPYSPTVVASATSDGSGVAKLTLTTAGTYNVGLSADYYYPSETLIVTEVESAPTTAPVASPTSSSRSGSSSGSTASGSAPNATTSTATMASTNMASVVLTSDEIFISINGSIEEFIRKYLSIWFKNSY